MNNNQKQFKKGFGLLEVLISAVIIIMILTALIVIGRKALTNSTYLQQRAQAIYLAQEGIEITRQIRDTNWTDGSNETKWDTLAKDAYGYSSLTNPTPSTNLTDNLFIPTFSDTDTRYFLFPKLDGPIYNANNANAESIDFGLINGIASTKFKRYIKIENYKDGTSGIIPGSVDSDNNVYKEINALKVTVYVEWSFDGQDRTASVSEILTNWRPNF